jgi:hypothetical protein
MAKVMVRKMRTTNLNKNKNKNTRTATAAILPVTLVIGAAMVLSSNYRERNKH